MRGKAEINIQMLKSMHSNRREQETTASRETEAAACSSARQY